MAGLKAVQLKKASEWQEIWVYLQVWVRTGGLDANAVCEEAQESLVSFYEPPLLWPQLSGPSLSILIEVCLPSQVQ